MKIWLNIAFFLFLSLGLHGQVSVNISFLGDTIDVPESIDDAMVSKNAFKDDDLLVYPIKTSDVINIIRTSETKRKYTAQILDQEGNIIKSIVLDAITNQIKLTKLSYGLYTLKIEPENTSIAEIEGSDPDSQGKGQ